MQYTSKYVSPIGDILLASDGAHLTGLWFERQKYFADTLSGEHEEKNLPVFDETKRWLDLYFSSTLSPGSVGYSASNPPGLSADLQRDR